MKNHLFTLTKVAISIIIMLMLFHTIDFENIISMKENLSYQFLLLAVIITPISIFIRAYRWTYLMNYRQGRKLVNVAVGMNITLAGLALNLFMPAQSGDIAKSYIGYRWLGIKERMLSISLYDKFYGISSIAFLGILPGLYYHDYYYSIISILAFSPFILLILLKKVAWIFHQLETISTKMLKGKINLSEVFLNIDIEWGILTKMFAVSVVGWLFSYSVLWISFKIISVDVSLIYIFMIAPILTLGRLFPFTLNGIGSDEAIIVFLFDKIGIFGYQALAAAFIYRLILLIIPGVIGLIIIWIKDRDIITNKGQ
jgi:glycosyltransferase 2 family protein